MQVNTRACCHLDAVRIERSLRQFDPPYRSIAMIENVGNLDCPALFDVSEVARIVIASVNEGDDKLIKYPHTFRNCDLVILNEIDLLPDVPSDVGGCVEYARQVNPKIQVIQVSAIRGYGLEEWYNWLPL